MENSVEKLDESTDMSDNLDELCGLLYERGPRVADYLGGSDAKMLKDASTEIIALRKEVEELKEKLQKPNS